MDEVRAAIQKWLPFAESYEPFPSLAERSFVYYRIYVFITVFTLMTTLFFMLLMEISWKLGVFYMESAIGRNAYRIQGVHNQER
ncbi:MAG: hypothetical protein MSC43_02800 [Clostridiales bacterium]|nr:hypothetical protein [Clostridiales bacterium]